MKSSLRVVLKSILLVTLFAWTLSVRAQGTAFTYQGMLNSGGFPAMGSFDLTFQLYNAPTNGTGAGPILTNSATTVSNGLFVVTLDFGPGIFTGTNYWVEIGARTNGGDAFTTLIPRLALTPTPYAIFASSASNAATADALNGTVTSGSLSGTYSNPVTLNNAGNSFTGNGAGLTNVNAATVGGVSASNLWLLNGNAGTTPGPQFLGTTDSNALELHVDGMRALRLEPNSNGFPNVIGGSSANSVVPGTVGATIGGGNGNTNQSGFATISGGSGNTIQSNALYAVIPGGSNNIAAGTYSFAAGQQAQALHQGAFVWADSSNAPFASTTNDQFLVRAAGGVGINTNNPNGAALNVNGAVVATSFSGSGAGLTVAASNIIGTVSLAQLPGGVLTNNESGVELSGVFSGDGTGVTNVNAATVGGVSASNIWLLNGNAGTTPGPQFLGTTDNNALELQVNGSQALVLQPNANGPNIIGGYSGNSVSAGVYGGTIAGGGGPSFPNSINGNYALIGGGLGNTNSSDYGTIGGGQRNTIQTSAAHSTIAGGSQNNVQASDSAIGGGDHNIIQSNAFFSVIDGGLENTAQAGAALSTIGGGIGNNIQSNASVSIIAGGANNVIQSNASYSTIGGGSGNTIQSNALYAVIPGGSNNIAAGTYSFAAGQQAQALHQGTFVWADSANAPFASTTNDQFLIRADGGVGINTNNPNGAALYVNGTVVATSFSGSGAGLTVAASNIIGAIPLAQLPGVVLTNDQSGVELSGVFSGDGTGVTNVNAATVGGVSASNIWLLNGNAGTTPGPQFLGTTDNNALELQVNGTQALVLQPNANGPNIIGGYSGNSVNAGVYGGTIAGGGGPSSPNTINGNYAAIGGGYQNTCNGSFATVAGGNYNNANGQNATVGGGEDNINFGQYSTINGGQDNNCEQSYSTVGGGQFNRCFSQYTTTGGGQFNFNLGQWGTIGGGQGNFSGGNDATIGGGDENETEGNWATISGGFQNDCYGAGAFIGGGGTDGNNNSGNQAGGSAATIGGGLGNSSGGNYATIGGGYQNNSGGTGAFIGGGGMDGTNILGNQAAGSGATIGGGLGNTNAGNYGMIGGGYQNTIQAGANCAVIAGGSNNLASGNYSFAAGQQAQALHQGAFVWADSQNASFASTANDQFSVRAQGGVVLTDGNGNVASWTPGSGSWNFSSDRNLKDRFEAVDAESVLDRVAKLPVAEWSYKGHGQRHIGAMAQDFHALFPFNDNDKVLNEVDLHGVELAAIKGLNQKLEAQASELKAKDAAIQSLEQRLERLESMMSHSSGE